MKCVDRMAHTIERCFNPNISLSKKSGIWFVLALGLVGVALYVAFSANWQNGGEIRPIYQGGVFKGTQVVRHPVLLEICPDLITIVWAFVIYLSLVAKRYISEIVNPMALLLVGCDIFLVASLIRSFLPAESIELFCFLGFKQLAVTVNPQHLLLGVVVFSWISMRTISGFGIVVLLLAFISRMDQLNLDLGMWGVVYISCGFLSLLIQGMLPCMRPQGGYKAAFLQDLGWATAQVLDDAKQNLGAVAQTTQSAVAAGATLAGVSSSRAGRTTLE